MIKIAEDTFHLKCPEALNCNLRKGMTELKHPPPSTYFTDKGVTTRTEMYHARREGEGEREGWGGRNREEQGEEQWDSCVSSDLNKDRGSQKFKSAKFK